MFLSVNHYGDNSSTYILSQTIKRNDELQASISWQLGSGTTSSTLAGLGNNRQFALQLSYKMDENKVYQTNVNAILNRLDLSSKGLAQLSSVAQEIYKAVTEMVTSENEGDFNSGGSSSTATANLSAIKQALNTVDNMGGYVFANGDGRQIPIPGTGPLDETPLAKKINSIVSDMLAGKITASEAITQATKASSDIDLSIFDPTLSSLSPKEARGTRKDIVVGDRDERYTAGIVATEGDDDPSDTTTGSPIKDLIRDTMLISAVGTHTMTEPGMLDLAKLVQTSMKKTSDKLINMEATTGSDINAMKAQQGFLKSTHLMLTDYMSDTISSDPTALALQSDNLKAQLQVSFTLISKMKDFSLANYI